MSTWAMTALTQKEPGARDRSSEAAVQGGPVLPTHQKPPGLPHQPLTVNENVDFPKLLQCLVHGGCDGWDGSNVQG